MLYLYVEEGKIQGEKENVKRQNRLDMELDVMVLTLWGGNTFEICRVAENTFGCLNGVIDFSFCETWMFIDLPCTAKSCMGKNCFTLSASSSTVKKS